MTPIETENEEQLVRLVKLGDSGAMKTMYSTYIRFLTALCSRYILNSEDVKDILQDSFIKIFSGVSSFEYRETGSLKSWMARITINEILKFLKRSNRFEIVEISEEHHTIPQEDNDALPSAVILQLIRELPVGYRTIFNLYVIENKTHREIASMLGIKESSSASQLHRAKSLLAAKIKNYNKHL